MMYANKPFCCLCNRKGMQICGLRRATAEHGMVYIISPSDEHNHALPYSCLMEPWAIFSYQVCCFFCVYGVYGVGTSHMCRSSEPQLRIEESSNGQTEDGPRSRNPGQKPDNKHKSALQACPDTGQVHDGEEAQCTLTGNGRSVDHVQVMIMSNGSHHSSGWACWNYSGFFMHSI